MNHKTIYDRNYGYINEGEDILDTNQDDILIILHIKSNII